MPTRRNVLQLGLAAGLGAMLPGCVQLKDLQPECAINWSPSLLSPVFHGFKDFATPGMRVYYPSLQPYIDASPLNAPLLVKCERYPLVIFIHGDCGGDPIQQWISLPAQLARSGYVVAVTKFGGEQASGDSRQTAPLRDVYDFMRSAWEFRDRLMLEPYTAVVGHSYGGTLAAQLAGEIRVAAFASLSGGFGLTPVTRALLPSLKVPSLFFWNKVDDGMVNADLDGHDGSGLYAAVTATKHAVVFKDGKHSDYLFGDSPTCNRKSDCLLVRPLSTDFVTTFLSKYLRPEFDFSAFSHVPEHLFVRPQDLPNPPENGFYAGAYLEGMRHSYLPFASLGLPCSAEIRYATTVATGTRTLMSA
jgi:dienelactone hydrolase